MKNNLTQDNASMRADKGKEIGTGPSEEPPHFLSFEMRETLSYASAFLYETIRTEPDPFRYYLISPDRRVFVRTEQIRIPVEAIKEYLKGEQLDVPIMQLWCM